MNIIQKAYVSGFVKRAAEYGVDQSAALELLKKALDMANPSSNTTAAPHIRSSARHTNPTTPYTSPTTPYTSPTTPYTSPTTPHTDPTTTDVLTRTAKETGKAALKKITPQIIGRALPGVGHLVSAGIAGNRLYHGDLMGALTEGAAGLAKTIPYIGTGASIGIGSYGDALHRDWENKMNKNTISPAPKNQIHPPLG